MTNSAVIFGAGKVGRGFLADLLVRSDWKVTLVDVNQKLVETIRKDGGYAIHLLNETAERRWIEPEGILHTSQKENLLEVTQQADLILTSIGAKFLENWAIEFREIICKRLELGEIDLILGENHPHPASSVKQALEKNATNNQLELLQRLGICQSQILRSCIEPNELTIKQDGFLSLNVQDYDSLPMDADALKRPDLIEKISGFEPRSNFKIELTRKLYTYNTINAVISYLGYLAGYSWLSEAANDHEIIEIATEAGKESSDALIKEYGFNLQEQEDWCNRAIEKYQDERIIDPIERQCRDPIRKLGRNDRLFGPLLLCEKHALPKQHLAIGIAAALQYRGFEKSNDPSVEDLIFWREEGGIEKQINRLMHKNISNLVTIIKNAEQKI